MAAQRRRRARLTDRRVTRPVDPGASRIVDATDGNHPTRVSLHFTDARGQDHILFARLGGGPVQQVPTPIDAAGRVTLEVSADTRGAGAAAADIQFLPPR